MSSLHSVLQTCILDSTWPDSTQQLLIQCEHLYILTALDTYWTAACVAKNTKELWGSPDSFMYQSQTVLVNLLACGYYSWLLPAESDKRLPIAVWLMDIFEFLLVLIIVLPIDLNTISYLCYSHGTNYIFVSIKCCLFSVYIICHTLKYTCGLHSHGFPKSWKL